MYGDVPDGMLNVEFRRYSMDVGKDFSPSHSSADDVEGDKEFKKSISTSSSLSPQSLSSTPPTPGRSEHTFNILRCPAYEVPAEEMVDTTGCGDTFIAGVIYGILHELHPFQYLSLGSAMASQKIRKKGARDGMPYADELPAHLLALIPTPPTKEKEEEEGVVSTASASPL